MAGVASGADFLFVDVLLVAVLTNQFRMQIREFKARILIMIEFDVRPVFIRMAAVTFTAVFFFMLVIQLMTEIAFFRRINITLIGMAIRADDILMFFFELKFGFTMIKAGKTPGNFRMTVLTVDAHAFFVRVISPMAIHAP